MQVNPEKSAKIVPVILSGGIGSRLWPLSRETHPKPFIKLDDGQSLIQKAYLRALSVPGIKEIVTVTNRELFFYTKDEYEEVQTSNIPLSFVLEPFGRNSAAAIAAAAHFIENKHGSESIMLVLPADHIVENNKAFLKAVDEALELVRQGRLVTFGILPDSPKTGYGYIETQGNKVLRFIEKPDLETAKTYLVEGNFLWNSGMFCFSVASMAEEMNAHCPKLFDQTRRCMENAIVSEGKGGSQSEIKHDDFSGIEDISIDYAIFEKSEQVAVVPADMGWSDIGTWIEFGELYSSDKAGNRIHGETVLEDVKNCVIHSESKVVAGIGLRDLIVVDVSDALLIANRNHVQDVRSIVKKLKQREHEAYKLFPTVHRTWGNYTVLQESEGFKIKRIEVKSGSALSLQKHRYRSEHWVVVKGRAKVVNGDDEITLEANKSTYIPLGNKHRLINPEKELLVLIEVQCGSYLGEDDIIRFESA